MLVPQLPAGRRCAYFALVAAEPTAYFFLAGLAAFFFDGTVTATFFARNAAQRFLVASAIRFRPAALIVRFFATGVLAALDAGMFRNIPRIAATLASISDFWCSSPATAASRMY